jgi:hypothetical protein
VLYAIAEVPLLEEQKRASLGKSESCVHGDSASKDPAQQPVDRETEANQHSNGQIEWWKDRYDSSADVPALLPCTRGLYLSPPEICARVTESLCF